MSQKSLPTTAGLKSAPFDFIHFQQEKGASGDERLQGTNGGGGEEDREGWKDRRNAIKAASRPNRYGETAPDALLLAVAATSVFNRLNVAKRQIAAAKQR